MNDRTYRYFHGDPLYPFGYGKSYSTFAYSEIKLDRDELQAGEPLTIEAEVKNTGSRDEDEVAELYLTYPQLSGAHTRAPGLQARASDRRSQHAGKLPTGSPRSEHGECCRRPVGRA